MYCLWSVCVSDLMTLGGLDLCMSQCLNHPQGSVRWRGAQLIASCAQNMPQVQCHLLSKGALPKLLQLTDSDPHPTVRVKALYAVSCKCCPLDRYKQYGEHIPPLGKS